MLARAGWLCALVLGLALMLFNLRAKLNQYQSICSADACGNYQLTQAQAAELPRLGLSLPVVAAYFTALSVLQALAFVAAGAVIFWRKSDDWLALFMSFALVAFGIGNMLDISVQPPGLAQFLMLLFQALGRGSLVLFLFFFPDGRFVPGWTRWLAPFAAAREVFGVFFPGTIIDALFFVVAPLVLLMQVYRYRRSSNVVQRQQTKWVVYGAVLGIGTYAGLLLLYLVVLSRSGSPSALTILLVLTGVALGLSFIPVSVGVAILRYRLFDIDLIIRRTLVYGALTALLAAVYFGSVVLLQAGLRLVFGQVQNAFVTVLSTLAIAALFVPLRRRLQDFIDRRFYRHKVNAAQTLAAFAQAARDEVDLDRLSDELVRVVQETMQPTTLTLWLAPPASPAPPAQR